MTRVLLNRSKSDEEEEIWERKVILLFRSVAEGNEKGDEMAFVQFKKCVPPLEAVDNFLGGVHLRWAAARSGENKADVDSLERENNRTAAREWLQVISVESALSTVHVCWTNIAVYLLTTELAWPYHRF